MQLIFEEEARRNGKVGWEWLRRKGIKVSANIKAIGWSLNFSFQDYFYFVY